MSLAVTKDNLQHLLESVPFTRDAGFLVHSLADAECTLRVPYLDVFERPGGFIGGPILMAAADVAMWFAIKTRLGFDDPAVTAEMKTNFLTPAAKEEFLCTAKVLRFGSRLIYGAAECKTAGGRLISHHTLTYIHPRAAGDARPG